MDALSFRQATIDDLPDIVRMLADDFLGQQRERLEDPIPDSYVKSFHEIDADPNNELIVACRGPLVSKGGSELQSPDSNSAEKDVRVPEVIGTLQLTFTPSLSYQASKRCTVESVRVDGKLRGQGIGREMMLWAIERAKEKGCLSIQLTTHNDRKDAHRFYENLGFQHSHAGMKLNLK